MVYHEWDTLNLLSKVSKHLTIFDLPETDFASGLLMCFELGLSSLFCHIVAMLSQASSKWWRKLGYPTKTTT